MKPEMQDAHGSKTYNVSEAAHRDMRRSKREITSASELRDVIGRARVLRVGFVDDEGMAVVPMNFGFEWNLASDGNGQGLPTFWLHSAGEGRKAEAWASSPEVALELDVEGGVIGGGFSCAYSFAYESVMAWGRIRSVASPAEKLRGLTAIMAHMAPDAPVHFSDEAVAHVAVWRIDVERISGKRREGTPAAGAAAGVRPAAESEPAPAEAALEAATETRGEGGVAPRRHSSIAGRIGIPLKKHDDKKAGKHKDKSGDKKGGRDEAKPNKDDKKASKKAREKQIEQVLAGEHCPGCGRHCKLVSPHCGKGKRLRAKRLEKAGLA